MTINIRRILLLVISFVFVATSLAQGQKRKPKGIVFNESHIELGTIDFGEKLIYELNYYNSSKKSIKITDIETSDSLIKLKWDKSNLNTGLFSKISVDLPTNNDGIFSKTLVVHSTARNSPVRLIFSGIISDKPETIKFTGEEGESVIPEDNKTLKSDINDNSNKKFKRIHLDEKSKTGKPKTVSTKAKEKVPPPKTHKTKNEIKEKIKIQ